MVRAGSVEKAATQIIFVDLDHTLVATDLAWESLIQLLKKSPLFPIQVLSWRVQGLAVLKRNLAGAFPVRPEILPYRPEVLDWLKEKRRAQGARIYLATAAPEAWARAVSEHLGLFDGVLASNDTVNLKGTAKLKAIKDICGDQKFTYLGDSAEDLKVWKEAAEAVPVHAAPLVLKALKGMPQLQTVVELGSRPGFFPTLWKAIRPTHWTKNFLTLVPLIASHQVSQPGLGMRALWAAVCFSLVASAVYVLNDIFDIQSDREIPSKRKRPIASGHLHIPAGLMIGVAFLILGTAGGLFLGLKFELALCAYFGITCFYTFHWKRVMGLDVVCLAALFTSRIFAGGYAIDVKVSNWLLGFSLFFFFGLACLKRYVELGEAQALSHSHFAGRGYSVEDRIPIMAIGATSSLMSLLVLVLYINGEDVRPLYQQPGVLWWLMPLFLYWVSRVWILAHRGQMPGDPIAFAVRDRASHLTLVLAMIIFFVAQQG